MTGSLRVVNCDIVMEIRRRPPVADRFITHSSGICTGDPATALEDVAGLGGIGVLIMDVRTGEQCYVPVEASDNHTGSGIPTP